MPKMNGLEVVAKVQQLYKEINDDKSSYMQLKLPRIIMISAFMQREIFQLHCR
jgi:CheY-like chemotaxis protein